MRVLHRFFNDFFFRAFNHAVFGRTAAINNYFLARGASCGIVFRPARSRIAFYRLRTAFADGSVCLSARRETYRHDHRRDCAKDFFECFHLFLSLFVFIVFGFFFYVNNRRNSRKRKSKSAARVCSASAATSNSPANFIL